MVHRLTRGRLWIGALTTLLVGIVSLNVLALRFNASSSKVGAQADALDREFGIARQDRHERRLDQRVQAAAARLGLMSPAGSVGYLRPSPTSGSGGKRRLG